MNKHYHYHETKYTRFFTILIDNIIILLGIHVKKTRWVVSGKTVRGSEATPHYRWSFDNHAKVSEQYKLVGPNWCPKLRFCLTEVKSHPSYFKLDLIAKIKKSWFLSVCFSWLQSQLILNTPLEFDANTYIQWLVA